MKRVVLLSGMDSLISWYFLDKPECLHVNLHTQYSDKEERSVNLLSHMLPEMQVRCLHLDWGQFENLKTAYLPFRNAVLCMVAVNCGYDDIVLTTQKGELALYDRSPSFMHHISEILSHESGDPVKVWTPFADMTKQQMVKWYLSHGGDPVYLLVAPGCYRAGGESVTIPYGDGKLTMASPYCGECACCFRKAIALEANGIKMDKFMPEIWKWEGIPYYVDRLRSGAYDVERTEETISVLKERNLW